MPQSNGITIITLMKHTGRYIYMCIRLEHGGVINDKQT